MCNGQGVMRGVVQRFLDNLGFTRGEQRFLILLLCAIFVGAIISLYRGYRKPQDVPVEGLPQLERVFQERSSVGSQIDKGQKASKGTVEGDQAKSEEESFLVDINVADQKALESLPFIGPVLAQRIIEYRQTHGAFQSIEELLNVKGIGKKRLAQLKPYITVKSKK